MLNHLPILPTFLCSFYFNVMKDPLIEKKNQCALSLFCTLCRIKAHCASAPPPRQHAFFIDCNFSRDFDSLGIMRQLILTTILVVNIRANSENLCEIAFEGDYDYSYYSIYEKPNEQEEVCKGKKD